MLRRRPWSHRLDETGCGVLLGCFFFLAACGGLGPPSGDRQDRGPAAAADIEAVEEEAVEAEPAPRQANRKAGFLTFPNLEIQRRTDDELPPDGLYLEGWILPGQGPEGRDGFLPEGKVLGEGALAPPGPPEDILLFPAIDMVPEEGGGQAIDPPYLRGQRLPGQRLPGQSQVDRFLPAGREVTYPPAAEATGAIPSRGEPRGRRRARAG